MEPTTTMNNGGDLLVLGAALAVLAGLVVSMGLGTFIAITSSAMSRFNRRTPWRWNQFEPGRRTDDVSGRHRHDRPSRDRQRDIRQPTW